MTVDSKSIPSRAVDNYLTTLVNKFFKILPMRESEESSLNDYMNSLMVEIIGFSQLFEALNNDSMLISLVSILKYLTSNEECSVRIVKREVFKAISICKKLQCLYRGEDK